MTVRNQLCVMLQLGLICKLLKSFLFLSEEFFKLRIDSLSRSCLVQSSFRIYQLFLEYYGF